MKPKKIGTVNERGQQVRNAFLSNFWLTGFASLVQKFYWRMLIILLPLAEVVSHLWPWTALGVYGTYIVLTCLGSVIGLVYTSHLDELFTMLTLVQNFYEGCLAPLLYWLLYRVRRSWDDEEDEIVPQRTWPIVEAVREHFQDLIAIAVVVLCFVVGFSQLLRYWYLSYGGFYASGTDYFYWVRYGLSWILDNGLANCDQIYNWHITDAYPTNFVTRALVWAFNILLETLVIGALMQTIQLVMATRRRKLNQSQPQRNQRRSS